MLGEKATPTPLTTAQMLDRRSAPHTAEAVQPGAPALDAELSRSGLPSADQTRPLTRPGDLGHCQISLEGCHEPFHLAA